MKKRVHVFVSGIVQGVGYRWFVRKNAKILNLKGWVANLNDGRVEAVIEGEEEKIEKILKLMKSGHPFARVDEIKISFEDFKGEFEDFEIKYV
jgi:acylphosphatase